MYTRVIRSSIGDISSRELRCSPSLMIGLVQRALEILFIV